MVQTGHRVLFGAEGKVRTHGLLRAARGRHEDRIGMGRNIDCQKVPVDVEIVVEQLRVAEPEPALIEALLQVAPLGNHFAAKPGATLAG